MSAAEFGYTGDEYGDNPIFVTSTNARDETITTKGYVFSFNHAMDYLPGWCHRCGPECRPPSVESPGP